MRSCVGKCLAIPKRCAIVTVDVDEDVVPSGYLSLVSVKDIVTFVYVYIAYLLFHGLVEIIYFVKDTFELHFCLGIIFIVEFVYNK